MRPSGAGPSARKDSGAADAEMVGNAVPCGYPDAVDRAGGAGRGVVRARPDDRAVARGLARHRIEFSPVAGINNVGMRMVRLI